jgi:hypothetical protein
MEVGVSKVNNFCIIDIDSFISSVGEQTAKLWANIEWLRKWFFLSDIVVDAVINMRQAFHVLYKTSFKDAKSKSELLWFNDNIKEVL